MDNTLIMTTIKNYHLEEIFFLDKCTATGECWDLSGGKNLFLFSSHFGSHWQRPSMTWSRQLCVDLSREPASLRMANKLVRHYEKETTMVPVNAWEHTMEAPSWLIPVHLLFIVYFFVLTVSLSRHSALPSGKQGVCTLVQITTNIKESVDSVAIEFLIGPKPKRVVVAQFSHWLRSHCIMWLLTKITWLARAICGPSETSRSVNTINFVRVKNKR